jgi:hypothetical protein
MRSHLRLWLESHHFHRRGFLSCRQAWLPLVELELQLEVVRTDLPHGRKVARVEPGTEFKRFVSIAATEERNILSRGGRATPNAAVRADLKRVVVLHQLCLFHDEGRMQQLQPYVTSPLGACAY